MTIKILLADDHQIVREGLNAILAKHPDLKVVGEAADGRTAVRLARDLAPDVVIIDIGMPDLNGIEATRQIVAEVPGVKVIALSMHADKQFVSGMLKAGAAGYLLKYCASEELLKAIQTVRANRVYLSPDLVGLVVEDYVQQLEGRDASAFKVLTPREREVLQLLAEGRTTREIAARLHVSVKTIEVHRKQMMDKLGLQSLAELIKYAIREGLTSLAP
ncbi:MAG: DNA-binding response regulator [Deltaproteobacteria bacterium RBG_13_58_19]|nr:MAG: DNA-binding response regulator [Deltaproteobacteria bacterium RBG_13_58_19]